MAKKKTAEGPNKYAAVLRLIRAEPNISQGDLVARLKTEGIDISDATVSNYRSKARKEVGVSKRRKGGRPRKAQATATVNGPPAAKPARGAVEDFITLAALVKKIGSAEVQRFVAAIS